MNHNDVIEVAERLYYEANPTTNMNVPSFAYEQVEAANKRRAAARSELTLYDWCKQEQNPQKAQPEFKFITQDGINEAAFEYLSQNNRPLFDHVSAFKAGADFILERLKDQFIIDLLKKTYHESVIERMKKWLEQNSNILSDRNEEFDLKVGDIILFKNGYDIPMRTNIIAFNAETGDAYLHWDCYWFPVNLKTKFISKY